MASYCTSVDSISRPWPVESAVDRVSVFPRQDCYGFTSIARPSMTSIKLSREHIKPTRLSCVNHLRLKHFTSTVWKAYYVQRSRDHSLGFKSSHSSPGMATIQKSRHFAVFPRSRHMERWTTKKKQRIGNAVHAKNNRRPVFAESLLGGSQAKFQRAFPNTRPPFVCKQKQATTKDRHRLVEALYHGVLHGRVDVAGAHALA